MRHVIARARGERGFTMVTVMAVMFCVSLLSIAALSAAQGDLRPGAHDNARKVAYAAAQAGIQNYVFHLSQDLDYWAKCTTGALPHAINDPWNGVSPAADPRRWTTLPTTQARYTIELLPANGSSACSTAAPDATMIDAASGTFKIRSTGQDLARRAKRSIVVTFKRQSLLDYLYFTDKETRAPGLYSMNMPSRISYENAAPHRDIVTWARQQCDRYHGNDPTQGDRSAQLFDGQYVASDGSPRSLDRGCNEVEFKAGDAGDPPDVIAGPLHTNDEILVACTGALRPQLGDSIDDAIETSSLGQTPVTPANPKGGFWTRGVGCGEPSVNFSTTSPAVAAGAWKPRAAPLTLPLTNAALKHDTAAAYRFKGTTRITMHGTTMNVTGTRDDGSTLLGSEVAIPADGVVYVSNDGSCPEYTPVDSEAAPPSCGNLKLQGDYAANVTFTAENDIVVTEDVTRTSSGSPFLLGMIAVNYVRVAHPVTNCEPATPVTCNFNAHADGSPACTNALGSPTDVSITGAILSLTKSFIVDNWFCGGPLGTLSIYGAIAQKYRGTVNRDPTPPAVDASGYRKTYTYDSKLKYRSPPRFLDPVQAQWRTQTFSEQVPAR